MRKLIFVGMILILGCSDGAVMDSFQEAEAKVKDDVHMKSAVATDRVIKVFRATKEVVIDGNDNEWSRAPKHKMRIEVDAGTGFPITAKSDLASEFSMLWDDENLYIYATIIDDEQNLNGFFLWERDCFEVYIDGDNSKNSAPDSVLTAVPPVAYGADDDFFRFLSNEPVSYSAWGNMSTANFEFVYTFTKKGYEIEIKMPFADLIDLEPVGGHVFGLEFQTNDNDGDIRQNFLKWASGEGGSFFDPSLFGTAMLVD